MREKMIRKIIEINTKKCNGCGICVTACHEGAIGLVNGKAKLMRDDYCDGLGDCLPTCPTGAISFIEREAAAYDEVAVKQRQLKQQTEKQLDENCCFSSSQLLQWPVQIQLVPIQADYFAEADLLIAADCTAYAYGNFHNDFMKKKVTIIACPKLDHVDYSEKLTEIIKQNSIKTITVLRMEVPCCGGIEYAVKKAIQNSGKQIPYKTVIISTNGEIR